MPLGRQYAQKASALETVASKLVGKLILFVLAQRYLKNPIFTVGGAP
jgi:hypothetical protein